MNKKKLSHSSLNSSITSVLAALLCILIGLVVGFLVLLAINPAHAWGDGFVRILKGGFHDAPYGVGKELANAAPLIMTGLSVAFAFKTGLFNIGAAGQYTLGAYGALYCAIMLKLPWFVCLIAATILGGIWGAIPGFFKAYFNINEVITSIMFNWIGLYLVNELIYQNGTGPMYDVRNTRTINISKNADYAQSIIPDFGLNKLFQTNSTTIAIFLAAAVAVLIWVVLNKTTFGYELKAVGLNKSAARYAGINEKKNIILSMAIAGALAGFGADPVQRGDHSGNAGSGESQRADPQRPALGEAAVSAGGQRPCAAPAAVGPRPAGAGGAGDFAAAGHSAVGCGL